MAGGNRRDRRLAAAQARRGAAAPPQTPVPPLQQALQCVAAGRLREAFDAFLIAVSRTPRDTLARAAFGQFLIANLPGGAHPDVDEAFRAALDEAWLRPDVLAVPVARYLAIKHPGPFETPLSADAARLLDTPGLCALLDDTLLLALLRATPAATPALDIWLARCRHALLAAWSGGALPERALPFLSALAERAATSGFALTLPATPTDARHAAAEGVLLAELLAAAVAAPPPSAAAVALLGCYRSLTDLPAEVWRDLALADVHAAHVAGPAREAAIAAALTPLTDTDATNAAVQAQYEAYPYPLWVREPVGAPPSLPPAVARWLAKRGPVNSVLVAGCGTGQHALAATSRWPGATILGIDISRASLAHAIRRVETMGQTRIRFGLADLLAADRLGQQFAVIESVGVLHHLADPATGLAALTRALAPDGILLIGLYARAARRGLAAARHLGDFDPASAEGLRAFRARALADLNAPEILFSPDFYSLGGVRDLVFHAREHDYDLPDVTALLDAAGLELLALEVPAEAARLISALPGERDLTSWDAAERQHPALFGGMYQLWARRRS